MHKRPPQHVSHEYHKIIERAYDCCRKNINPNWVIEPDDVHEGLFRGLLFGTKNSPIPGSAFKFTLFLDAYKLAEQPEISFECNLSFHPYFFKSTIGTDNTNFCFPNPCTCRDDLNVILDNLWKYFFLDKIKKNSIFSTFPLRFELKESMINQSGANDFIKSNGYGQFWDKLRALGNIQIPAVEENEQNPA